MAHTYPHQPATTPPDQEPLLTTPRRGLRAVIWQSLAILFCLAFGLAMTLNTQMAGEGVWFWYTNAFHHGAKLYSGLHLALQPLYILQTDLWMKLFGTQCLVTEIPSALRIVVFGLVLLLILRQSDRPDWEKAIALAGLFILCLQAPAYRFDDYHIVADTFIYGSLASLLAFANATSTRRQVLFAAITGLLTGLTITTRVNDGAALLAASAICLLFFARRRKLLFPAVLVAAAALTVLAVVACTGDSFSSYISNSLIKAAGSKGGAGSIFAAPLLLFRNALLVFRHGGKTLMLAILAIAGVGAFLGHRSKAATKYIVPAQLALAALAFLCASHLVRDQLLGGTLIEFTVVLAIVINYLLAPIVLARYLASRAPNPNVQWDRREVLILLPLAELASSAASTGGQPHQGFYSQVAMLLLLCIVIRPFRHGASWVSASLVTLIALLGITGVTSKIRNPYSWQNYDTSPMFQNRVWFHHPVFGPLYINRDDLALHSAICADIHPSGPTPELLSLPYPYPNYFCAIPPWHGYVQTFFDTSTRATINQLMAELDTSPPQWIVYQRQLYILGGAERLYNHGQPLAQRDLDQMIMRNIATGKWQLIDRKPYPPEVDKTQYLPADGWYVIRTHP